MSKTFKLTTAQREAKPRSKRLRGLGVGAGGGSTVINNGGDTAQVVEGHTHANKADLDKITTDADGYQYITQPELVDEVEVETTRKVKAGWADVAGDLSEDSPVRKQFLSRVHDDTAEGRITFEQGAEFGDYVQGKSGAAIESDGTAEFEDILLRSGVTIGAGFQPGAYGGRMWADELGKIHIETDYLDVRARATFREIEVQEETHVGGCQIISPAGMRCSRVARMSIKGGGSLYRCYFNTTDSEGAKVYNQFSEGDLARCQTFNLEKQADGTVGNRYYWRKVIGTGYTDDGSEGYIDLSDAAGEIDPASVAPAAGDCIVTMGNCDPAKSDRANLIILASYGTGSPYIYQFKGITTFALTKDNLKTAISPDGNLFTGRLVIENSGTETAVEDYVEDSVSRAPHFELVPNAPSVKISEDGKTCTPARLNCTAYLVRGINDRTAVKFPLTGGASDGTQDGIPSGMVIKYVVTARRKSLGTDGVSWLEVDGTETRLGALGVSITSDMVRVKFILYRESEALCERTVTVGTDTEDLKETYNARFTADEKEIKAQAERITDTETDIAALSVRADEINSKVTENGQKISEISQKADNISLKVYELEGYENLITGNSTGDGWRIQDTEGVYGAAVPVNGVFTISNPKGDAFTMRLQSPIFKLKANTTYTISFDCAGMADNVYEVGVNIKYNNNSKYLYSATIRRTHTSQRHTYTFTTTDAISDALLEIGSRGLKAGTTGSAVTKVSNIMIEEGGTAHDYIDGKSGLLATGIDIDRQTITLTADSIMFRDSNGDIGAMFDSEGRFLAKFIKVDDLNVNRLIAGVENGERVEITPEQRGMVVYDSDGKACASYVGTSHPNGPAEIFSGAQSGTITAANTTAPNLRQGTISFTIPTGVGSGHQSSVNTYYSKAWHSDDPTSVVISAGSVNVKANAVSYFEHRGSAYDTSAPTSDNRSEMDVRVRFYLEVADDAAFTQKLRSWLIYGGGALANSTSKRGEYSHANSGFYHEASSHSAEANFTQKSVTARSTVGGWCRVRLSVEFSGWRAGCNGSVTWSGITAAFNSQFYRSEFFANGFALGISSNQYVVAYCDASGRMHFEAQESGYGLQVGPDGIKVKHHSGQYITMPLLVWRARVRYSSTSNDYIIDSQKSYNGSIAGVSRTSEGVVAVTFPTAWTSLGLGRDNTSVRFTPLTDYINAVSTDISSTATTVHLYRGTALRDGDFIIEIYLI